MKTITDYITGLSTGNNYIYIIAGALILLVILIGFLADRANKRKKAKNNEATGQAVNEGPVTDINANPSFNTGGMNNGLNDPMGQLGRAATAPVAEPTNMAPTEPTMPAAPTNMTPAEPMVETTPIEEPLTPVPNGSVTPEPTNMTPIEPMIETTPVEEPVNMTPAEPMVETTPIEPTTPEPVAPTTPIEPAAPEPVAPAVPEPTMPAEGPANVTPPTGNPTVPENTPTDIPKVETPTTEKPANEDIEVLSE